MGGVIHDVSMFQHAMGYWEIHINGEFYCTADNYNEAVKEIKELCERSVIA